MRQYNDGGGKVGFLLVILIIIIIGLFIFIGGNIGFTKRFHSMIFGDKSGLIGLPKILSSEIGNTNIIIPSPENDWCKIQEINVGDSNEDFVRDRIIGWDSINNCCVREVSGFNCAINGNSVMRYCYTAHISGVIKYVVIDGYYGEEESYKEYLEDYDKQKIENKICDIDKYPVELQ